MDIINSKLNNHGQTNKTSRFLLAIIVIELILGGSGRVLVFGLLTLRLLLLCIAVLYCFVHKLLIQNNFTSKFNYLYYLYFAVIFVALIHGLFLYEFSDVFEHFKANVYILMYFPFLLFIKNKDDVDFVLKILLRCSLLLSIASATIFIFFYFYPMQVYNIINPILLKFDLGSLSFQQNGFPRVFFKCVPYISAAFIVSIFQFKTSKILKTSNTLYIFILFFGCIVSFTMGVWLAIAAGFVIFLFARPRIKFRKIKIKPIFFFVFISAIIIAVPLIIQVLTNRINPDDNSVIIKSGQMKDMLELFMQKPIFGHGFGKIKIFNVSGIEREMSTIELFWLDLLANTGIVGFLIGISFFIYPFFLAFKISKRLPEKRKNIIISAATMVLVTCINSTFNPFLNNSIGLGIFFIAIAIINVYYLQMKKTNN